MKRNRIFLALSLLACAAAHAAPLLVKLPKPAAPESGYFKMGTARSPDGHEITFDSRSLLYDGQPFIPAMGEFHYSRYPADEWREELLKMKAGGIDIVATYVFWIHHEEVEGVWDWSGQRSLRKFIEAARDVGMKVVVRCGPWCHGEVRNGGLPEWVVQRKDWKTRSTDPKFLDAVHELYGQIALQVRGLLWKDGGPIVGIQVDNEFHGPAAYLLALKGIARDVGLDVPIYTRTGWPSLTSPMPIGEIVPLFGVYAEGFWDRDLTSMPSKYWAGFHFSALRTDNAIATEMLGSRDAKDDADVNKYPFLTCEIGGGMMNSYHRRILVDPRDIAATTLIKIAGGSTLPGYYMYHGGTNPEGKLTTLMEAQNTLMTNYNDLPVKTYDFQAPLGEFGEIRPHYHWLRRLHFFLHDYGGDLAGMNPALPEVRPSGREDVTTVRWAARSNGRSGFIFVNNYERGKQLPAKNDVQFALALADGSTLTVPSQPVTIPPDAIFWWPFNLELHGATYTYATAQPFTHILDDNGTRTLFFAETPGVKAEFAFAANSVAEIDSTVKIARENGRILVTDLKAGHDPVIRLKTKSGESQQIVLLSDADSLALWKGQWGGRNRVVLTRSGVVFDNNGLRVTVEDADANSLSVFPVPSEVLQQSVLVRGEADGIFERFTLPTPPTALVMGFDVAQEPGEPRVIKKGPIKQGVAQEPDDADFASAGVWRLRFPEGIDLTDYTRVRLHYVGDVARVTLNGKLLTDDFYNGNPRELGLKRFGPEILKGDLRIAVLPLSKDAPIFFTPSAKPDFGGNAAIVGLRRVELLGAQSTMLSARP